MYVSFVINVLPIFCFYVIVYLIYVTFFFYFSNFFTLYRGSAVKQDLSVLSYWCCSIKAILKQIYLRSIMMLQTVIYYSTFFLLFWWGFFVNCRKLYFKGAIKCSDFEMTVVSPSVCPSICQFRIVLSSH